MTTSKQSERKRAKNFLAEEEVFLVDLVEAHESCIENKKSDAIIWKQKQKAWLKFEDDFAATSGANRPWKTLRDKYESIKRKSKTEMAEQKLETYRTGGEVASTKASTVSEKIASMLGESGTGLQNNFDSDCQILIEVDVGSNEAYECSSESDQKQKTGEEIGESNDSMPAKTDWSNGRPTLKQPKSKELVAGTKRKRCIEDERMKLIILQQQSYRDEILVPRRSMSMSKNELLQLELSEETSKLNKN